MIAKNSKEVNQLQLVLVEGPANKSTADSPKLTGRSDGNKRCVFHEKEISIIETNNNDNDMNSQIQKLLESNENSSNQKRKPVPGDYIIFITEESKGQTLYGRGLGITTLSDYHNYLKNMNIHNNGNISSNHNNTQDNQYKNENNENNNDRKISLETAL